MGISGLIFRIFEVAPKQSGVSFQKRVGAFTFFASSIGWPLSLISMPS